MKESDKFLQRWREGKASLKLDGIQYTAEDKMPDYHLAEFQDLLDGLDKKYEMEIDSSQSITIGNDTYANLSEVPTKLKPEAEHILRARAVIKSNAEKIRRQNTQSFAVFFAGLMAGFFITKLYYEFFG